MVGADMTPLARLLTDRWPWLALAASAGMLAAAHAFETFGHLPPCTLCLRQREAHWIVVGLAGAGVDLSFSPWGGRTYRWVCLALVVAFAWSTYQGAFHAGVEWHWWPGPTTCASTSGARHVSAADMAAILNGGRIHGPACDQALWHLAGISMAGWNALISLALTALSAVAAWRGRPSR